MMQEWEGYDDSSQGISLFLLHRPGVLSICPNLLDFAASH